VTGGGQEGRPTVALVLGSGGARGLAHVGVIETLIEYGYEIAYISGCSMGALVGGAFAAGRLEAYRDWAVSLERKHIVSLLDFSFGWQGLFKGEKVIGVLRELIGAQDIEDLPIGYTAVATDLNDQREVWLNTGPLFDAIRASIAIPSLLTPWRYRGRVLVDGGLLNPVPIAPALNHAADLIVAVNLNASRSRRAEAPVASSTGPASMFEAMVTSFETMQATITRLKLAAYTPDVVVEVPRDACLFYEFERAAELIEVGRRCARDVLSPPGRVPAAGAPA
jgi:NTE family protein